MAKKKSKSAKTSRSSGSNESINLPSDQRTLDQVLIALQKTMSRVSSPW